VFLAHPDSTANIVITLTSTFKRALPVFLTIQIFPNQIKSNQIKSNAAILKSNVDVPFELKFE